MRFGDTNGYQVFEYVIIKFGILVMLLTSEEELCDNLLLVTVI